MLIHTAAKETCTAYSNRQIEFVKIPRLPSLHVIMVSLVSSPVHYTSQCQPPVPSQRRILIVPPTVLNDLHHPSLLKGYIQQE
jgi:hypothetical protein